MSPQSGLTLTFQDHLPGLILPPQKELRVAGDLDIKYAASPFSVITTWPATSRLFWIIILPTHRPLSPVTSKGTVPSLPPLSVSTEWPAISRPSSSIALWHEQLCFLEDLNNDYTVSLPKCHGISRSLPHIPLLTWWALQGDIKCKCWVSPPSSNIAEWSAISRSSPEYS